jgi:hypothetical protein
MNQRSRVREQRRTVDVYSRLSPSRLLLELPNLLSSLVLLPLSEFGGKLQNKRTISEAFRIALHPFGLVTKVLPAGVVEPSSAITRRSTVK